MFLKSSLRRKFDHKVLLDVMVTFGDFSGCVIIMKKGFNHGWFSGCDVTTECIFSGCDVTTECIVRESL